MVEHRGLGGPGGARFVVGRHGVEQLGSDLDLQRRGAVLDQPQPEMDVPKQPAFLGRAERRPALELERPSDVVEERGRQHEVRPQARVQLRGLAAERRDADRVLEQPARIGMVCLGRRQRPQRLSQGFVLDEATDGRPQAWVGHLVGQELQKAVQLGGVTPERRSQVGRVRFSRRL